MFANQKRLPRSLFGNFNNCEIQRSGAHEDMLLKYFNECCYLLGYMSNRYLQYFNVIKIPETFVFSPEKSSETKEIPKEMMALVLDQLLNIEEGKLRNLFLDEDYWRKVDLNNLFNNDLLEETMIKKSNYIEYWRNEERLVKLLKYNNHYFNDSTLFDPVISILAILLFILEDKIDNSLSIEEQVYLQKRIFLFCFYCFI